MYATTIKAELIGDQQVNINTIDDIVKAVGFVLPTEEQFKAMTDEQKEAAWKARDAAFDTAKEKGLYDPDFAYWRKFNHLHGWMERLYYKKGGTDEVFNCSTVRLTAEDLDQLATDAKNLAIEPTEGFFFGSYGEFTVADQEEVLEFVIKAREAISNGYAVIYDSWW